MDAVHDALRALPDDAMKFTDDDLDRLCEIIDMAYADIRNNTPVASASEFQRDARTDLQVILDACYEPVYYAGDCYLSAPARAIHRFLESVRGNRK